MKAGLDLRQRVVVFALVVTALSSGGMVSAQRATEADRATGREMLTLIRSTIEKNYYDPTFRGIDLKARFDSAARRIDQAVSNGEILGIIAQVLLDFDDSHLNLIPPERAVEVSYGFRMRMIGDRCFVLSVEPGSDAAKQGLKPGDQILRVDNYEPSRPIFWKLRYMYYRLRPRARVRLTVAAPEGTERSVEIASNLAEPLKMQAIPGMNLKVPIDPRPPTPTPRNLFREVGKELYVWKMSAFRGVDDQEVDAIMARAKKHQALILDLRGNGGGFHAILTRLLANVFDHDIKLCDSKERKKTKPVKADSRGKEAFKGKIVVLVDSDSASASELFARILQLEHRGTVVGDVTAGMVMEALHVYDHTKSWTSFGTSVTVADLIMTDGKSLEHVGVTPDELLLPTAADLATGRDPVLARAAALLGVDLTPEAAGSLFALESRK